MSNGVNRPARKALQASNATLRRGIEELAFALEKYGGHAEGCSAAEEHDCACGWISLRARLEQGGDRGS